jgi:hypothetical protein
LGDNLFAHFGPDFCDEVIGLANGHLYSEKMLIETLLEARATAEYGDSDHFRTFLRGTGQLARGHLRAFDPLVHKGVASGNVALKGRRIHEAGAPSRLRQQNDCREYLPNTR